MIVSFEKVGKNKESWKSTCDAITHNWLCNQVKMMAGVVTNSIHFTADGYIFAGHQQIGSFRFTKTEGE